jgi:toxin ParE1/3/4
MGHGDGRVARQAQLMPLRVHPAARGELHRALEWSRGHFGARVAWRLQTRFEAAGEMLLRQPGIGTPARAEARKLPLRGFPYTIVYRVDGDVVHVLALMHQSRMPDYWVGRR